ncbi:MAG: dual specificity protein phosphatase family protein [Planctomycetes bacterium]|nr:dual specificity protein phosphatase family protein [Planctomycetota bacterium]
MNAAHPLAWLDGIAPLRVAVTPCPRPEQFGELRAAGVDVLVSMLEAQEQLWLGVHDAAVHCAAHGIEFVNVPVRDRSVPDSADHVSPHAQKLAAKLREGKGVLFHCFAGIGRSPLMAACTLAILGHDVHSSFARISAARRIEVPDTQEQLRFAIEFARAFKPGP